MLIVESLSLATKCISSKELWRCNLKDVLVVTVATEIGKRHLDATKLQCGSNILQPYLLTFGFVSYFKIEQVIFNILWVYSGILDDFKLKWFARSNFRFYLVWDLYPRLLWMCGCVPLSFPIVSRMFHSFVDSFMCRLKNHSFLVRSRLSKYHRRVCFKFCQYWVLLGV